MDEFCRSTNFTEYSILDIHAELICGPYGDKYRLKFYTGFHNLYFIIEYQAKYEVKLSDKNMSIIVDSSIYECCSPFIEQIAGYLNDGNNTRDDFERKLSIIVQSVVDRFSGILELPFSV